MLNQYYQKLVKRYEATTLEDRVKFKI